MKLFKRLMAGTLTAAIMLTSVATAGGISQIEVGDIDMDGMKTVSDIILLKKAVMEENLVKRDAEQTDVNGDGETNVDDIIKLKSDILDDDQPATYQTAKIKDGEVFLIENVHSGLVINGNREGDRTNQWTYTGSLTQQWKAVKYGDYYMIVSLFNGQVWTMDDAWNCKWVYIRDAENLEEPTDRQLFKFESDENGAYFIHPKSNESYVIQVEWNSTDTNVHLQESLQNNSLTEKWVLYNAKDVPGTSDPDEVLSDDFADTVYKTFMDQYYLESRYGGHAIKDKNYFWDWAEMLEMVIDAYENNPCDEYQEMVEECMDGFIGQFGSSWAWNDYNDDIMWMVIACSRAYNATGVEKYKETAKTNFDIVYKRGYNTNMGGGLLWRSNGNTSKNSCINCPAVIGATYIYELYKDKSYLDKAIDLFEWQNNTLVVHEGDDIGRVYDSINDGNINENSFTYNLGTYIGAATRLYEITGQQKYLDLAKQTADYTVYTKYHSRVINDEGNANNFYEDLQGFKGIFMRWFGYYINSTGDTDYDEWIYRNLYNGWCNRNSKGLVGTRWNTRTSEYQTGPFNYYNYVVLAQIAPYRRLRRMVDTW